MCQQIIQFCAGSTKPLLFAGSLLLILAAIALGYTGHEANTLYEMIDQTGTALPSQTLTYYLQLVATVYLSVVTVLAAVAAYYDQKNSIRALSLITSVNFVLAVAAVFLLPTVTQVGELLDGRLTELQAGYFTNNPAPAPAPAPSNQTVPSSNSTNAQSVKGLNATEIWDRLQGGLSCCGRQNSTLEWTTAIPKSCCANPDSSFNGQPTCKRVDPLHECPCKAKIENAFMYPLMLMALIALINLYLATVTGISTYRTFHYNEASQNAYT